MTTPAPAKPALWFVDTSSLLSLAADDNLRQTVQGELVSRRRVLLDVVVDELERLASQGPPGIKDLAVAALGQLDWLGEPVDTDELVAAERVVEIQDIMRSGRSLRHPAEHWAESVIMAMAERLQQMDPYMLCEDYNARVESLHHNLTPFSIHKLLARMVQGDRLAADEAVIFADALQAAERGKDYTAAEFISGRLGRVGQP
ncbi:hypothetical protein [Streptomyces sp. ATCC 21386]|uniref:hypothetical protein n=1 Tax=Streptomyces sp. ATCC 21386 TaxID=2699428 RepID=UPI001BFFAAAB|nr:hypothetical protein [Streptomyces sp. ATCC 21386]